MLPRKGLSTTVSLFTNVSRGDIRYFPFPHLVIENCLPADLYAQLDREYPTNEPVLRAEWYSRPRGGRTSAWMSPPTTHLGNPAELSAACMDLIRYHSSRAFFEELVTLLGPEIKATYPLL